MNKNLQGKDVLPERAPDPLLVPLETLKKWVETERNPRHEGFLQGVLYSRVAISLGLGRNV